ncbi:hypothetical protein LINPERPRIM_LOCUS5953 [Linum perenne]
MSGFGRWM